MVAKIDNRLEPTELQRGVEIGGPGRLADCDRRQETNLRIEAIRAASQIISSGYYSEYDVSRLPGELFELSNQIAHWLETGK